MEALELIARLLIAWVLVSAFLGMCWIAVLEIGNWWRSRRNPRPGLIELTNIKGRKRL